MWESIAANLRHQLVTNVMQEPFWGLSSVWILGHWQLLLSQGCSHCWSPQCVSEMPCSHFVTAYFETGLLYFFFLQASWKSLLAWPGKWQYFHSVQHGFRQQNLALILELSKLLKQELNQMPRSPPKTQTKPVLRFRDVWITLNKTMLYFYRSCFQLSLQAEIQKKVWQADLYLHCFWPSWNREALENSQKQLCLTGYPTLRSCYCYLL